MCGSFVVSRKKQSNPVMCAYFPLRQNQPFLITIIFISSSVRLNERKQRGVEKNKKMAYLVDLKTITVGRVSIRLLDE